VSDIVNNVEAPFKMYLDDNGEAWFVHREGGGAEAVTDVEAIAAAATAPSGAAGSSSLLTGSRPVRRLQTRPREAAAGLGTRSDFPLGPTQSDQDSLASMVPMLLQTLEEANRQLLSDRRTLPTPRACNPAPASLQIPVGAPSPGPLGVLAAHRPGELMADPAGTLMEHVVEEEQQQQEQLEAEAGGAGKAGGRGAGEASAGLDQAEERPPVGTKGVVISEHTPEARTQSMHSAGPPHSEAFAGCPAGKGDGCHRRPAGERHRGCRGCQGGGGARRGLRGRLHFPGLLPPPWTGRPPGTRHCTKYQEGDLVGSGSQLRGPGATSAEGDEASGAGRGEAGRAWEDEEGAGAGTSGSAGAIAGEGEGEGGGGRWWGRRGMQTPCCWTRSRGSASGGRWCWRRLMLCGSPHDEPHGV